METSVHRCFGLDVEERMDCAAFVVARGCSRPDFSSRSPRRRSGLALAHAEG